MDTGTLPDNLTGGGNLEMTPNTGLGDTGPTPQPANAPVTLDQGHSAPMQLDPDNDRDMSDATMEPRFNIPQQILRMGYPLSIDRTFQM